MLFSMNRFVRYPVLWNGIKSNLRIQRAFFCSTPKPKSEVGQIVGYREAVSSEIQKLEKEFESNSKSLEGDEFKRELAVRVGKVRKEFVENYSLEKEDDNTTIVSKTSNSKVVGDEDIAQKAASPKPQQSAPPKGVSQTYYVRR
eukprot:TRINITY_DN2944_c0_g1_i1.p1 TRINITY_DN2944_c0_g1~~TRINITY_DN2944_c0_g1_i1.p1  ORF type:complete len:144 (-),score=29.37 TRINITY_DN2944_c0_g1_i1:177-608(-)